MVGEDRKVDHLVGSDGVRYKVVLTPDPEKSERVRPRKKLKRWQKLLPLLITLSLVVLGLGSWRLLGNEQPSTLRVPQTLQSASESLSFPIYYPSSLPLNYKVDPSSVKIQAQVVNFSILTDSGTSFIVTQQAMPPLIEEVKKTSQFDTPVGEGYIADIEGNVVGFIKSNATLVIISNVTKGQSQQLELILKGFDRPN
jgi:hypothetical protein